ncbi:unnamed protein product [Amoebophrya sp. A25]|nr:unnamed protein product [Amoebophrya sp. A25]|eukprot:GSA25T00002525001.1
MEAGVTTEMVAFSSGANLLEERTSSAENARSGDPSMLNVRRSVSGVANPDPEVAKMVDGIFEKLQNVRRESQRASQGHQPKTAPVGKKPEGEAAASSAAVVQDPSSSSSSGPHTEDGALAIESGEPNFVLSSVSASKMEEELTAALLQVRKTRHNASSATASAAASAVEDELVTALGKIRSADKLQKRSGRNRGEKLSTGEQDFKEQNSAVGDLVQGLQRIRASAVVPGQNLSGSHLGSSHQSTLLGSTTGDAPAHQIELELEAALVKVRDSRRRSSQDAANRAGHHTGSAATGNDPKENVTSDVVDGLIATLLRLRSQQEMNAPWNSPSELLGSEKSEMGDTLRKIRGSHSYNMDGGAPGRVLPRGMSTELGVPSRGSLLGPARMSSSSEDTLMSEGSARVSRRRSSTGAVVPSAYLGGASVDAEEADPLVEAKELAAALLARKNKPVVDGQKGSAKASLQDVSARLTAKPKASGIGTGSPGSSGAPPNPEDVDALASALLKIRTARRRASGRGPLIGNPLSMEDEAIFGRSDDAELELTQALRTVKALVSMSNEKDLFSQDQGGNPTGDQLVDSTEDTNSARARGRDTSNRMEQMLDAAKEATKGRPPEKLQDEPGQKKENDAGGEKQDEWNRRGSTTEAEAFLLANATADLDYFRAANRYQRKLMSEMMGKVPTSELTSDMIQLRHDVQGFLLLGDPRAEEPLHDITAAHRRSETNLVDGSKPPQRNSIGGAPIQSSQHAVLGASFSGSSDTHSDEVIARTVDRMLAAAHPSARSARASSRGSSARTPPASAKKHPGISGEGETAFAPSSREQSGIEGGADMPPMRPSPARVVAGMISTVATLPPPSKPMNFRKHKYNFARPSVLADLTSEDKTRIIQEVLLDHTKTKEQVYEALVAAQNFHQQTTSGALPASGRLMLTGLSLPAQRSIDDELLSVSGRGEAAAVGGHLLHHESGAAPPTAPMSRSPSRQITPAAVGPSPEMNMRYPQDGTTHRIAEMLACDMHGGDVRILKEHVEGLFADVVRLTEHLDRTRLDVVLREGELTQMRTRYETGLKQLRTQFEEELEEMHRERELAVGKTKEEAGTVIAFEKDQAHREVLLAKDQEKADLMTQHERRKTQLELEMNELRGTLDKEKETLLAQKEEERQKLLEELEQRVAEKEEERRKSLTEAEQKIAEKEEEKKKLLSEYEQTVAEKEAERLRLLEEKEKEKNDLLAEEEARKAQLQKEIEELRGQHGQEKETLLAQKEEERQQLISEAEQRVAAKEQELLDLVSLREREKSELLAAKEKEQSDLLSQKDKERDELLAQKDRENRDLLREVGELALQKGNVQERLAELATQKEQELSAIKEKVARLSAQKLIEMAQVREKARQSANKKDVEIAQVKQQLEDLETQKQELLAEKHQQFTELEAQKEKVISEKEKELAAMGVQQQKELAELSARKEQRIKALLLQKEQELADLTAQKVRETDTLLKEKAQNLSAAGREKRLRAVEAAARVALLTKRETQIAAIRRENEDAEALSELREALRLEEAERFDKLLAEQEASTEEELKAFRERIEAREKLYDEQTKALETALVDMREAMDAQEARHLRELLAANEAEEAQDDSQPQSARILDGDEKEGAEKDGEKPEGSSGSPTSPSSKLETADASKVSRAMQMSLAKRMADAMAGMERRIKALQAKHATQVEGLQAAVEEANQERVHDRLYLEHELQETRENREKLASIALFPDEQQEVADPMGGSVKIEVVERPFGRRISQARAEGERAKSRVVEMEDGDDDAAREDDGHDKKPWSDIPPRYSKHLPGTGSPGRGNNKKSYGSKSSLSEDPDKPTSGYVSHDLAGSSSSNVATMLGSGNAVADASGGSLMQTKIDTAFPGDSQEELTEDLADHASNVPSSSISRPSNWKKARQSMRMQREAALCLQKQKEEEVRLSLEEKKRAMEMARDRLEMMDGSHAQKTKEREEALQAEMEKIKEQQLTAEKRLEEEAAAMRAQMEAQLAEKDDEKTRELEQVLTAELEKQRELLHAEQAAQRNALQQDFIAEQEQQAAELAKAKAAMLEERESAKAESAKLSAQLAQVEEESRKQAEEVRKQLELEKQMEKEAYEAEMKRERENNRNSMLANEQNRASLAGQIESIQDEKRKLQEQMAKYAQELAREMEVATKSSMRAGDERTAKRLKRLARKFAADRVQYFPALAGGLSTFTPTFDSSEGEQVAKGLDSAFKKMSGFGAIREDEEDDLDVVDDKELAEEEEMAPPPPAETLPEALEQLTNERIKREEDRMVADAEKVKMQKISKEQQILMEVMAIQAGEVQKARAADHQQLRRVHELHGKVRQQEEKRYRKVVAEKEKLERENKKLTSENQTLRRAMRDMLAEREKAIADERARMGRMALVEGAKALNWSPGTIARHAGVEKKKHLEDYDEEEDEEEEEGDYSEEQEYTSSEQASSGAEETSVVSSSVQSSGKGDGRGRGGKGASSGGRTKTNYGSRSPPGRAGSPQEPRVFRTTVGSGAITAPQLLPLGSLFKPMQRTPEQDAGAANADAKSAAARKLEAQKEKEKAKAQKQKERQKKSAEVSAKLAEKLASPPAAYRDLGFADSGGATATSSGNRNTTAVTTTSDEQQPPLAAVLEHTRAVKQKALERLRVYSEKVREFKAVEKSLTAEDRRARKAQLEELARIDEKIAQEELEELMRVRDLAESK